MTLILTTIVGDAAVMCADTRIQWIDAQGVGHAGSATKMSLKGGCIIGTYGSGSGVHVGIARLPELLSGPVQLADAVRQLFWPNGPARMPDMGALIAGFEQRAGAILRVEHGVISRGLPQDAHAGGAAIPPGSNLQPVSSADAKVQQLIAILRTVSANDPNVGPPYDCVVLRRA